MENSKYFKINGYWKDNKSEFSGYIVKEFDDVNEENDDEIFFYGLGERDLKEAMDLAEDTAFDFVITSYEETSLNSEPKATVTIDELLK